MTNIRSNFDLPSRLFPLISDSTSELPNTKIVEERIGRTGEIRKYMRGNFLGKGGFARCYELTDLSTQKVFAAKIIPKATLVKPRAKAKLLSEIKIHHSLSHDQVVKFHHYFEDHENVYILLEVCHNQTLNDMLKRRKRISDVELQNYLLQLIEGLRYIHSKRVIHRDLKLGNLFLSEKMELKLGDFGLATKLDFDGETKKTVCGTPNYIAPEILENKGHSYEVDLWSVGVIAYTLIIGKPPFETSDVKTTYKRIKAVAYTFPDNVSITPSAKDLISRLLVRAPEKRLGFDEIMAHEFMTPSYTIPKFLPVSTVAVPLNAAYIRSLSLNSGDVRVDDNERICTSKMALRDKKDFMNLEPRVSTKFPVEFIEPSKSPRLMSPRKTLTITPEPSHSDVCVSDWIDYSNKYGVGYLLSNGVAGVYFNDATKMLIDGTCKMFIYFDRKSGEREDTATLYTTDGYPTELHKKLTLLQHFKSHLEDKQGKGVSKGVLHPSDGTKQIYVKKWLKTKHAILLRLSNKMVQVVFQDGTTIYLSTEQKMVFYLNKKKEKLRFPLSTAMEAEHPEMVKRLKYTKNLLNLMLHRNGKNAEEENHEVENEGDDEILTKPNFGVRDTSREALRTSGNMRRSVGFSKEIDENEKGGGVYRMSSLARFSPDKLSHKY